MVMDDTWLAVKALAKAISINPRDTWEYSAHLNRRDERFGSVGVTCSTRDQNPIKLSTSQEDLSMFEADPSVSLELFLSPNKWWFITLSQIKKQSMQ